jgi:hypothetical protein
MLPIIGEVDSISLQKYHCHLQSRYQKLQHKQIVVKDISKAVASWFPSLKANKTFLVVKVGTYKFPEAYVVSNRFTFGITDLFLVKQLHFGYEFEGFYESFSYGGDNSIYLNYRSNSGIPLMYEMQLTATDNCLILNDDEDEDEF